MDKKTVKENVRKVRKEIGLTQAEMASLMSMSRTAYRNFEKGDTEVFSKHISKIAEISGKTEEEIVLGYTPDKNSSYFLREVADCRESMKQLRTEYEKRLKEKDRLISALEKMVKMLQDRDALQETVQP